MKQIVLSFLLTLLLVLAAVGCSIFRAGGDTVRAVGEGTGEAVEGIGDGAAHAVSETGRAIDRAVP